jgi:signal transduction histidine kinase/CheY-like chemotaxis protein
MTTHLNSRWVAIKGRLPERLREHRSLYVVMVFTTALFASVLAAFISSSAPARSISMVFSVLLFSLLLAFIRGLPESKTVYAAAGIGVTYLFLGSLTEGHIYSSNLAWLPLIPLVIFYFINPRAGRLWMLLMVFLQVLVAAVAWVWGDQLPPINVPELPVMSLIDLFMATIVLFVVPDFYQRDVDRHLLFSQQRQRDLQAKQVELEHAQQMQEHFIASVSHELRTPMNAILGLNNLLLERVKDKPQASKVLAYTRQSADHLMTVINDVLDYSQFNMGQISARVERFALRETVQAAFELFQPKVENTTLRYTCEIGADVPQWVSTDRHRLMQVLVNLLGNAIKFTHQGGVTLQVSAVDGGVAFAIQDTGIGIASDQQQRIFERFSQADASIQSRYGGSGLGLTISQRLVQMLGGQLQLESHEGAGSRFWFWLPLQGVAAPEARAHEKEQVSAGGGQGLRFLVVDDHPVNRLLVQQVLARHWPQADVEQAQDGREALQKLQQQGFDLVLMDMVMPVMDGIEATTVMRASADARMRQTPVLGLTANVNAGDLARFEQSGLNGLLLKPFEQSKFVDQMDRLVQRRQPGAPADLAQAEAT